MERVTNKRNRFFAALLLCAALTGMGCQQAVVNEEQSSQAALNPVERGKYLVTIIGCNDCHTPLKMGPNGPEPDMARMLSGHPESLTLPAPPKYPAEGWNWGGAGTLTAFAGPWGITYAINLTPDENTGIGAWTEEMFIKTIRNGRHMGGEARPIQPPMPWYWYSKMTDEDLKAIYAYLRTIPPIVNRVPEYQPPATSP